VFLHRLDPQRTSALWYPGHAHAVVEALASSEIYRIVAFCIDPISADGKALIKCQSSVGNGSCFLQISHERQRGRELKMGERVISVGVKAAAEPIDRVDVGVGCQLAHPDKHQPKKGTGISRGQSESFKDVLLHLFAATQLVLAKSDESMCVGHVSI
jgi:hypothetical protein